MLDSTQSPCLTVTALLNLPCFLLALIQGSSVFSRPHYLFFSLQRWLRSQKRRGTLGGSQRRYVVSVVSSLRRVVATCICGLRENPGTGPGDSPRLTSVSVCVLSVCSTITTTTSSCSRPRVLGPNSPRHLPSSPHHPHLPSSSSRHPHHRHPLCRSRLLPR